MRTPAGAVRRPRRTAPRRACRDRSYSASRSVRFRLEIGRNPCRDRSGSAPRSVVFRVEIGGTTGARLWCVSTSETGVSVSGVVVPGGVILGSGDRMGRAGPLRAGSAGVRVCPRGWWVLHTRAHRVLVGTAESCGTALSVTVMALLPCAQPPHRTWEPDHHTPRSPEKLVIPTKTSLGLTKAPVSHVQHQRQPHPKHAPTTPRTEIGPIQPDQPDVEARTTSSRAKTTCHTSGTVDKQHTRGSTTDLGTGYDRSRAEVRPISTRNRTDLGEGRAEGRAGPRAARPLGVGRRRREETATPPPLVLFPCQAREMREASSTCSGVGRTPV